MLFIREEIIYSANLVFTFLFINIFCLFIYLYCVNYFLVLNFGIFFQRNAITLRFKDISCSVFRIIMRFYVAYKQFGFVFAF